MIQNIYFTLLSVFVFAIPLIYHSYKFQGVENTIILLLNIMGIAIIVELIGVTSGAYIYTGQTLILVTIFVGIGWILNTYPSMHIALYLLGLYHKENLKTKEILIASILSASFGVIYDLFIDPVAVALEIWVWSREGPWYGVPIFNFIGWFFIIFSMVFGYLFTRTRGEFLKDKLLMSLVSVILGSLFVYLMMMLCVHLGI
ncbi:MAG: carotenoid biosynthesis protein [Candidatus Njordarchaeia archaeon]